MLKNIAIIFGIVMIVVGILGFTHIAAPNGYLLGIFHVNFEHNLVHITTGCKHLMRIGKQSCRASFLSDIWIIYGLVALLGLYYVDQPILGIIANNVADIILHAIIAVFALYLGFNTNPQLEIKD